MNYVDGLLYYDNYLKRDCELYIRFIKQFVDYKYIESNFNHPLSMISFLSSNNNKFCKNGIKPNIIELIPEEIMSENINEVYNKFLKKLNEISIEYEKIPPEKRNWRAECHDLAEVLGGVDNIDYALLHRYFEVFIKDLKNIMGLEHVNIFKLYYEKAMLGFHFNDILYMKRELFIKSIYHLYYYIIPHLTIKNYLDYDAFIVNAINLLKKNSFTYLDIVKILESRSNYYNRVSNILELTLGYTLMEYSDTYENKEIRNNLGNTSDIMRKYRGEKLNEEVVKNMFSMFNGRRKQKAEGTRVEPHVGNLVYIEL